MEHLRAVLIDDERDALESLAILLKKRCTGVKIIANCSNGRDGLDVIKAEKPDLIFLDIEMPGMSGFQMLKKLGPIESQVIFVTGYDQYAIDAIKVSAMDYLLKPVDEDELAAAVEKATLCMAKMDSSKQLEVLLTNIRGMNQGFQKLAIPAVDELRFINIGDILYCKASGNYTSIFTKDGEEHLISKTLKDTADLLSQPFFFRTHQSYLINLNYIKRYIRGAGGQIELQNGDIIQVSRARKDALLQIIYK